VETIDILHRHLYRDADEKDLDTPVFSFTRSDIMTIIHKHESIQRKGDNKVIKRKLEQDLDAYAAIEARTERQKRQRRARDFLE
jgi:hypothetical protein